MENSQLLRPKKIKKKHENETTYDISNLRGGTRKVGKQERNRRKNEGERAEKKT